MRIKRILIAAPSSGSGKTIFTCGLLNLLKRQGRDVTGFKCGPDYIDPMFHDKVLGIGSGNLDTCFCTDAQVADTVAGCGHEYAVIEGVMGIYDGLGGLDLKASCYDVARASDTPVLLLVDARGAGRTIISVIRGILEDDSRGLIKGIILNKVSKGFYGRLSHCINEELSVAGFKARVLGHLPQLKDVKIESRHLGLMRPDETAGIREMLDKVADGIEEFCDVPAIMDIMENTEELKSLADEAATVSTGSPVLKLAVAKDEAFCFYYRENLKLLESRGIELVFFSPMHDAQLPKDIAGIYLGGGYPELYLKELSENKTMIADIRNALEGGIPSVAECGGFMYLHEQISDDTGKAYDMAGLVKGSCEKKGGLQRFGYVGLSPAEGRGGRLINALDGMKGHEFHYYDSTDCGCDMIVKKAGDDKSWMAMHISDRHVWGFPHMYFASCPGFVSEFAEVMRNG